MEDGASRLTFAELREEARSFGAALVAAGVEPGDRVAIWAFNSVEWVVAMLGSSLAGAVLVPVNTRFKGAEAADILARSRARVLVTVTDFLGTDYVEHAAGQPAWSCPTWRPSWWPGARRRTAPNRGPAFSVGPAEAGRAEVDRAARRARGRTIRRTSSSPRGRPACPRGWS